MLNALIPSYTNVVITCLYFCIHQLTGSPIRQIFHPEFLPHYFTEKSCTTLNGIQTHHIQLLYKLALYTLSDQSSSVGWYLCIEVVQCRESMNVWTPDVRRDNCASVSYTRVCLPKFGGCPATRFVIGVSMSNSLL